MYNYFKNLFDEVSKIMKDDFEETVKECEDCEGKSYYHMVSDKYEDGKHVSHKEKEVKDGKVVKDIDNCMNIEDKCEENKKCCKKESCNKENKNIDEDIEFLLNKKNAQIESLKSELSKQSSICDSMSERLKELEGKKYNFEFLKQKAEVYESRFKTAKQKLIDLAEENQELKKKIEQIRNLFK